MIVETRTSILLTIVPPTHGKGLEQPGTSDKHSESIHAHHQMTLHLRVLIAAATRHPSQPEGLGTNPSRLAEGWCLPREARGRLARSVEAHACTPTGYQQVGRICRPAHNSKVLAVEIQSAVTLPDRTFGGGDMCGLKNPGEGIFTLRGP